MDIRGKINVFVETKTRQDGTAFKLFNTSITRKNGDVYLSKSIDVKFDPTAFPPERLAKLTDDKYYVFDVFDGWLSVETYKTRDGEEKKKIIVWVKGANPIESKPNKRPAHVAPSADF